jgi:hypothetical protein
VNDRGIVVNSSTSTSSYNLEVYGTAGAYIRGPLKVLGDITYSGASLNLTSTLAGYNSSINSANNTITTLSGRIFTISGLVNTANLNITSVSGRLNTANTNILTLSGLIYTNSSTTDITSISGRLNTATTDITSVSGRLNSATTDITSISGLINTATTDITSISGRLNTATTNITTISGLINTATTNITTISGLINTANTNITTISGLINTANTSIASNTTSINTLNTKTTKIHYPGTLNTTFIGRSSINEVLDFSDGGLIMNNTSEILGKNFGCNIYAGNGFFFNTNSNRRSDFVNIVGYSPAPNWATLGGFEFWVHSFTKPPYVVASINYLGSLTISGITASAIVATNNITSALICATTSITSPLITASTNIRSPLFTATTRIITPYITVNSLYNIGTAITISSNITLTFPLPEIIFCNCTSNAINITLPNIATLAASSSIVIGILALSILATIMFTLCWNISTEAASRARVGETGLPGIAFFAIPLKYCINPEESCGCWAAPPATIPNAGLVFLFLPDNGSPNATPAFLDLDAASSTGRRIPSAISLPA